MRAYVVLTLATLLLAGCAGTEAPAATGETGAVSVAPGPDGPGSLPDGTLAPPTLTLKACIIHHGVFPVDDAALHDVAPAGFEPEGAPQLLVQARRCTLDDRTYNTVLAGFRVTPPAPYAREGASHMLWLIGINTHSEVRALWAAWGLAPIAQPGESAVFIPAPKPVPGVTHSDASNENVTLDLYVTVSGTAGDPEQTFRNLVVAEKAVVGIFDEVLPARSAQEGTAVLQVSGPQSPPAPSQTNGDAVEYLDPFDVTMTYVPVPAATA